jgi:SulP family sulfate permease
MSSNWHRPESETRILEQKGDQAVIFELQGSLFFGTTQQLYGELEPELKCRNFVILDMKRVQSVDVTAAHLLTQICDSLAERGAMLLLSNVRENLPNNRNLREFLAQTGVTENQETVRLFSELDSANEWVEDRLLGEKESDEENAGADAAPPLELHEMELFTHRKDETLADLEARLIKRRYATGDVVYSHGQPGDEIYLIRRGTVKIFAPLGGGRSRHVATFGRGDFFGGLAFLDGLPRGNDAIAGSDTEFFVLSQEEFNNISEEHKRLALTLLKALARSLALRLRHADNENAMLQEY